jgi:hypothetical protein
MIGIQDLPLKSPRAPLGSAGFGWFRLAADRLDFGNSRPLPLRLTAAAG